MHSLLLLAERTERAEREARGASNSVIILCVIAAVAVAIIGRLVTHRIDSDRIRTYARDQGWELISCAWKLFGPGWFGNSRERIYSITYRDQQGRAHSAFAKTSLLSGVYLTEDRLTD